eukprot:gnl/Chilomastix_cuspidata/575.p1 GENE.gnl/Chilomastix_cuspidata/575~~gnl/Chilomastix_cuspidata/575.p1  ORF type:complete len:357 (+),score=150.50 gnl/Chilomastix_cuspidata/575:34-1071(+)
MSETQASQVENEQLRKELAELRARTNQTEMASRAKMKQIIQLEKQRASSGSSDEQLSEEAKQRISSVQERQQKTIDSLEDELRKAQQKEVELVSELEKVTDESYVTALRERVARRQQETMDADARVAHLQQQIEDAERRTEEQLALNLEGFSQKVAQMHRELHKARYKEQMTALQGRTVAARNAYMGALMAELMARHGDLLRQFLPELSLDGAVDFRKELEARLQADYAEPPASPNRLALRNEFMDIMRKTLVSFKDLYERHERVTRHHRELLALYDELIAAIKRLDRSQTKLYGKNWALLDRFRAEARVVDKRHEAMLQYALEYSTMSQQLIKSREALRTVSPE